MFRRKHYELCGKTSQPALRFTTSLSDLVSMQL